MILVVIAPEFVAHGFFVVKTAIKANQVAPEITNTSETLARAHQLPIDSQQSTPSQQSGIAPNTLTKSRCSKKCQWSICSNRFTRKQYHLIYMYFIVTFNVMYKLIFHKHN